KASSAFAAGLADDLNISEALAAVFGLEHDANRLMAANALCAAEAAKILDTFKSFNKVLAVFDFGASQESQIPPEITELAQKRQQARKGKDFKTADVCRDQLKAAGWVVEDTPKGPILKKG
ncbi:MAG: cysteine--tRNA ligase, partial [Chitinivibrionia bacterium]|nr:cysteine--tRNA ligase [Chitinivibrionia bacterium]